MPKTKSKAPTRAPTYAIALLPFVAVVLVSITAQRAENRAAARARWLQSDSGADAGRVFVDGSENSDQVSAARTEARENPRLIAKARRRSVHAGLTEQPMQVQSRPFAGSTFRFVY
ncbi:MAG: hypothetical protein Q8Q09_16765 [Deltaproteobacteria bacterium]|nr:hypothetical protein [Deltaproteobacteria bacterium]